MKYLTHLINGLQHNSGIHELRTPIPLSIADLNVVFLSLLTKRTLLIFIWILREVTTKLKQ